MDGESVVYDWLGDNAMLISAVATVLMALVWVIYGHIGVISFLHYRRPRIIIDQTEDRSLNTKFVIVNLSEQPVYISCVMVAVIHDGEESVEKISTYSDVETDDGVPDLERIAAQLQQDTLGPGNLFMLGDTNSLLAWTLGEPEDGDETPRSERLRRALADVQAVEVRILAVVGVEDRPVGSVRRFVIDHDDGDVRIRPESVNTHHLYGWRARRRLREWSEFCIRS